MTTVSPQDFTCPVCNGSTRIVSEHYPTTDCRWCQDGKVTIDRAAIRSALLSSRGASRGKFRRSRPALPSDGGVYGVAYCWRMIRFDAGMDMTLPVAADFYVGIPGKEISAALDEAANAIGVELFGLAAMMRGAALWRGATTGDYQLADALGVGAGTIGTEIGGPAESPEYWAEQPPAERAEALAACGSDG